MKIADLHKSMMDGDGSPISLRKGSIIVILIDVASKNSLMLVLDAGIVTTEFRQSGPRGTTETPYNSPRE